jgi:hypothetical protein
MSYHGHLGQVTPAPSPAAPPPEWVNQEVFGQYLRNELDRGGWSLDDLSAATPLLAHLRTSVGGPGAPANSGRLARVTTPASDSTSAIVETDAAGSTTAPTSTGRRSFVFTGPLAAAARRSYEQAQRGIFGGVGFALGNVALALGFAAAALAARAVWRRMTTNTRRRH